VDYVVGLIVLIVAALLIGGFIRSQKAKDVAGDMPVWLWRGFLGVGLAMLVIAAAVYGRHRSISEFSAVLSGMFAASAVGGALGFLFAIPRAVQSSAKDGPSSDEHAASQRLVIDEDVYAGTKIGDRQKKEWSSGSASALASRLTR
jgi:hypothetical protein